MAAALSARKCLLALSSSERTNVVARLLAQRLREALSSVTFTSYKLGVITRPRGDAGISGITVGITVVASVSVRCSNRKLL